MARKKFYGSNTGKRSPSIQNSLIIELSDTSSEDSPIKKAAIQTRSSKNVGQSTLKAFESIRASTPMMTRTVNSNVIQRKFGGIRLRSGNILHKNVTTTDCSAIESLDNNVQPVVELQPIEIGDEPSQKMDFQVKVILERMTKKTIQKKMHNVNVAGVVQALTPTIQDDTFKINYKCWQWQPKLKLKQLTKNDLDGHMKSESSAGECRLVEPIKFDREEPVIRELSPETATKSYQQRIEVIKKSLQPHPVEASAAGLKHTRSNSSRRRYYKEYEEIHKRVQKTGKKRIESSGGRRLYNHGKSSEIFCEDENSN